MDFLPLDFILHVDRYIGMMIQNYGLLSYLIIFLIIFGETGLVIAPLLPGDSLLFIAGTFAGAGLINVFYLFIILVLAAILGDSLNYSVGNYLGKKIIAEKKLFSKEYLDRTRDFFEKHGNKTIIMARFLPIIRTFAPFVAGVGKMHYPKFLFYFYSIDDLSGFLFAFAFL